MLFRLRLLWLILVLLAAVVVACSPAGGGEVEPTAPADQEAEEQAHEEEEAEHGHAEGEEDNHDHSSGRLPNEGAVVEIVSPADGAVFGTADEILVEVQTENYELSEPGNHWHVYVDGASYGMIVGGDTDHALRNLEPGEHEISVYLSNEAHEELEEGDAVTILVE